jgi:hypothetical protein
MACSDSMDACGYAASYFVLNCSPILVICWPKITHIKSYCSFSHGFSTKRPCLAPDDYRFHELAHYPALV